MSDLKQSIVVLFVFVVALLGIANVEAFQETVIDFSPIFFVLIAVVLFSELIVIAWLAKTGVRTSQYSVIAFWLLVYSLVWYVYLREDKPISINLIQLLLVLLTAFLAYDVARRVDQTDLALEKMALNAYPNRAREIGEAHDIISAEITRSRRYHHPLSILAVRLEKSKFLGESKDIQILTNDILERFAIAKVSKLISEHARSTDVILRDPDGQFFLLCPETGPASMNLLAERIAQAVKMDLEAEIECGFASFPDEAMTFDDLLYIASRRLTTVILNQKEKEN